MIDYGILKEIWTEMGYLYAFTVYIENRFDAGDNITIEVNYYLEDVGSAKKHTVFPGERIGFPLHKKEDYLELVFSSSNNLPDTYYFSGAFWCNVEVNSKNVELVEKKEVIVVDKGKLDVQLKTLAEVKQELKKLKEGPNPVYRKWKITSKDTWTMKLSKPDHDPESDNGAVGPDVP